jgi:phosphoserine phosphatase RsbU/P
MSDISFSSGYQAGMSESISKQWHDALVTLLESTQQAQPDEIADCVSDAVQRLGLAVSCYLIDEEQQRLHPLPARGRPSGDSLKVDGTVAGRAFTMVTTQLSGPQDGPRRLWVPMVDSTERLGVVCFDLGPAHPEQDALRERCETLVNLVGHLLAGKLPYGDLLARVRRTRPMSTASELLIASLPPLTFSCERMVVSAILEPCYDIGGDAFDYAVDGLNVRFVMLDAMGRGLGACLTAVTALAAIRAARRDGHGLYAMARAADAALTEQFGRRTFATAVLGDLDLDTGLLRYINAGHPRPLVLRRSKAVRELTGGPRLPLGLDDSRIQVGEEMLEPGDRLLLHTDGVVEARDPAGEMFGVDRLIDLAEQAAVAELPAPETLRRLSQAVRQHQDSPARDDATLMLLEWSAAASRRVTLSPGVDAIAVLTGSGR